MPIARARSVALLTVAVSAVIVTLALSLLTRASLLPAPSAQSMTGSTATPLATAVLTSAIPFGDVATLVNPFLTRDKFIPGEEIPLTLFWYIPSPTNADYYSFVHVLDQQGQLVAQADFPLYGADVNSMLPPPPNYVADAGTSILLPFDLPPGQYQIAVGIYDTQSGQRLTTDQGETTATIGTIEVVTPLARFGNMVTLTDVKLPTAQPAPSESLELSLHWMVSVTSTAALNTFVHVIDSQGNLAAQADQPLAQAENSIQTITLQLPSEMAAGTYQIMAGVYDPATGSHLTTDNGESRVSLTSFEVAPKAQETADTAHFHLVFAPEDRALLAPVAAQLEESFKQVCVDLECETVPTTCAEALGQRWCSPYLPSLTMTVFVRGNVEPMIWLTDDQLTLQVPSPRASNFYAADQPNILSRMSDLSLFVDKLAWPAFIEETRGHGGYILYAAIVQWEAHRLAQRLGQINSPDPFRPDRLSTHPARSLDTLWNADNIVSIDQQMLDESVALITFIAEQYGDQAVAKLLKSVGKASSLSDAMETSLEVQYSDFEQRWHDWLKQYDIK